MDGGVAVELRVRCAPDYSHPTLVGHTETLVLRHATGYHLSPVQAMALPDDQGSDSNLQEARQPRLPLQRYIIQGRKRNGRGKIVFCRLSGRIYRLEQNGGKSRLRPFSTTILQLKRQIPVRLLAPRQHKEAAATSLISQGDQRIDARRPPGRYVTSNTGDNREKQNDGGKRLQICGSDPEKQTR